MLVITRKFDEELSIGDDIIIKIVEISPNSVKLGITAPRNLQVNRLPLQENDNKDEDQ